MLLVTELSVTKFVAASTSMPRSLPVTLLAATRLLLPVTWIPAPSPLLPLPEELFSQATQLLESLMPSPSLFVEVQFWTMLPWPTLKPMPVIGLEVALELFDPAAQF